MTEINNSAGRTMSRITGAIAAVIVASGAATASMGSAAAQPAATASLTTAGPARVVPVANAGMRAAWRARAGQSALLAASGSSDYFNSDSCRGGSFCMAVGGYTLAGSNPALSEVLSGGTWMAEPVPSPALGINIYANEVSCASAASCLFVGQHWAGKTGTAHNLAEFWNGQSWRIVTATGPSPSGLDDVACPTVRFCLAVGYAGPARSSVDTAYTWTNGTTWRRIAVPDLAHVRNSELGGLACSSSSNCMAVGDYTSAAGHYLPFAAHWHMGRWTLLSTPAVRGQRYTIFQGISCPTSARCVAVGQTQDASKNYHAFAEIWSDGKWHVSTLRRTPSVFIGVSCPERNRCYAAGYAFPFSAAYAHSLIETWNGQVWTVQHAGSTPEPYPGSDLTHVSCVSASDCAAVGERYPATGPNSQTLALKLNGSSWAVQTTPNP